MNAAVTTAAAGPTRVGTRWTDEERELWRQAIESEEAPRPTGTMQEITAAAMKHMQRPRPVNHILIKEAALIIRELRRQRDAATPKANGGLPPLPLEHGAGPSTPDDDPRKPSPAVRVSYPAGKPQPAAPKPDAVAAPAAPATTLEALDMLTDALTDRIEDAAVGLLVSVIDRTLSHPSVIRALHTLVQSAFVKEVQSTLDKTAPWSEKTVLSRLPRVLVVGLRQLEQERATEAYGQTLALRYWDEKQQSRGLLKQLIHGSQQVVVLPARISHATMQMIRSRSKSQPLYVNGYGDDAMRRLEEVAKLAIVSESARAEAGGG